MPLCSPGHVIFPVWPRRHLAKGWVTILLKRNSLKHGCGAPSPRGLATAIFQRAPVIASCVSKFNQLVLPELIPDKR